METKLFEFLLRDLCKLAKVIIYPKYQPIALQFWI